MLCGKKWAKSFRKITLKVEQNVENQVTFTFTQNIILKCRASSIKRYLFYFLIFFLSNLFLSDDFVQLISLFRMRNQPQLFWSFVSDFSWWEILSSICPIQFSTSSSKTLTTNSLDLSNKIKHQIQSRIPSLISSQIKNFPLVRTIMCSKILSSRQQQFATL